MQYDGPGMVVHPEEGGEAEFLDVVAKQQGSALFNDRQPTFTKKLTYRVFCALILPGGRMLVGGAPDGSIDVINPETGAVEMTLKEKGHCDSVMAMAISPHGLFSASADHQVIRWSMRDLSHAKTYYGHEGMVTALCVAQIPGASGLFSAGDDQNIIQWNIETGTAVNEYDDHKAPIYSMAATGQHLFSGDGNGMIHIYDITRRHLLTKIEGHRLEIWAMKYDEELGQLYTASGDATIKVWPNVIERREPAAVLTGHRGAVRTLFLDEDGILFSGGVDSIVACWEIPNQQIEGSKAKEVFRLYTDSRTVACQKAVTAMGFSNNEVIAVGFDKVINRWDVTDLLNVEHEIIDLPPLGALEEQEMDKKLEKLLPQDRHQHYVNLEVGEAIRKYTELPINYIIESLNYKVESSWLTSELAVYLPFLIMFLFFFLYDYNAMDVFYMNNGIENLLEGEDIGQFKVRRNFLTITNAYWWQVWVGTLFFGQLWGGKATTEWYEPFRFQGQNQLIGAVRFRTQRVSNSSCEIVSDHFTADSFNSTDDYSLCFGKHHGITGKGIAQDPYACAFPAQNGCVYNSTQMQTVLGFESGQFTYDEDAGSLYRGLKFYPPGGYVVDIPAYLSETDANNMANIMIQNGFVDDTATRFVAIEFFSYNPELQLYVQNRMMAEVYAGGAWHMNVHHLPFKIFKTETSRFRLVYEAIFFCFVTYWLVTFFTNMSSHYRMYGSVLSYLFSWWNLLEVLNIALFYAMFFFRWSWFAKSQDALLQLPFDNRKYPSQLDTIGEDYQVQVNVNAVNTILTFLKMLKYMQLNDQLNILTRTLGAAQQNIIGVLVLFIYFVAAFALTAHNIYGANIFGFRTLDAAYNTLMRVLVGDQDYEAMSLEAREWTLGFYWAFIICAQFMLLNFLIAVLSDAFQEVCDSRLPISLDKAIVRAAQTVKKNFLPSYIRITFLLFYNRTNRTNLTAKQVRFVRKYRDALLSEDALKFKDYDELEFFYIRKDWFVENVPEELRTEDNLNFMDEIWFDMSWEWHFRLKDKYTKARHEQQEIVDEVLQHELWPLKKHKDEVSETLKTVSNIKTKIAALATEL